MSELTAALATIEKCRELSGCPAGVDLQDHLRQLAAENVGLALDNLALKQIVDSVTDLSNEPQYHAGGMGCGLEDRGITDRYDACRYGWDEAMERVYGEVIPCADELDFSATDDYLAGIKADGRVEGAHFVANRMLAAWDAGFIEDTAKNAADIARMILTSTEFMAGAPEGDFDRSFADGILEDIAQQLREGAK
ncbi:hypothetical protein [Klebsiella pneumoniae]|uniref:hypothetical protein n=1 Tax=Klebsiella pneumoniae TaxID=573 RepID=UPI001D0E232E|nr:hypothetical protein [Klebsiella pneumoniae]WKG48722.1 hypothetical protein QYQ51_06940 [Klebsiella pneumoniae]WKH14859.1 hypothetical protein QYQ43_06990 [Klebsiella pneumoniae]WKH18782.1 hypothetical protein QYQ38_24415 [Klebsiella pneumoniae]WKH26150.1 hypothetical protein QYQ47_06990 [Klebsiella pneumoniae]WKH34983.1 hypothetical protein QYQ44_20370 [Klebsiella pneumoniae]